MRFNGGADRLVDLPPLRPCKRFKPFGLKPDLAAVALYDVSFDAFIAAGTLDAPKLVRGCGASSKDLDTELFKSFFY
jgi:hypothetical protein